MSGFSQLEPLRSKRNALAQSINELIDQFQEETGLVVTGIEFKELQHMRGNTISYKNTAIVRVELPRY